MESEDTEALDGARLRHRVYVGDQPSAVEGTQSLLQCLWYCGARGQLYLELCPAT